MSNLSIKEQGERVFHKCLSLLETRLKIRIKNAILLIDTDFGEYEFILKDDPEILIVLEKHFHKRLNTLLQRRFGGRLIMCDSCFGTGEGLDSGSTMIACPKCKGGGEVYLTEEIKPINQENNNGELIRPNTHIA